MSTAERAWEPRPGWTLANWCNCYRAYGLDVTIRGGEFVGLWISEQIVAVVANDSLGAAILENEPTTTLARADRDGLILLASGDVSMSGLDVPGMTTISSRLVSSFDAAEDVRL